MKALKKILCLLLALSLLVLAACGSFTPRMAVALKRLSELRSFHSETTLDAEVSLSLLGQELPLALKAHAVGDHQAEPALNALTLDLDVWEFTQRFLFFTHQEGDELTVSMSLDEGSSWMHQTLDLNEGDSEAGADISTTDLLGLAVALSSSFEEVESADGSFVSYEGEIPAEMMQQLLRSTGALERLSEAVGLELDDSVLSAVGALPAAVTIDQESGMIVLLRLDLTNLLSALTDQLVPLLLAQIGLDLEDAALSISRVEVVIELSQFDAVTVVPPAM
ncbi:MAG: hypothetical protein J6P58_03245 [Oscillospiraceae bacterium]|nr:hypothetical protein [Oscillospiraceae bacterium]